jgi:hypothetical protein
MVINKRKKNVNMISLDDLDFIYLAKKELKENQLITLPEEHSVPVEEQFLVMVFSRLKYC